MNYGTWIADYVRFVNGLRGRLPGEVFAMAHARPPLSNQQLVVLEKSLGLSLPKTVQGFLCLGSSGATATFSWKPPSNMTAQFKAVGLPEHVEQIFGGAALCHFSHLEDHLEAVRDLAEELDGSRFPGDRTLLQNCLPIVSSPSSEYVVLDLRAKSNDPAVLSVSAEGQCRVVAKSFTGFLEEWAAVCYVGLESVILETFLNANTGLLNGHSDRAAALKKLLAD